MATHALSQADLETLDQGLQALRQDGTDLAAQSVRGAVQGAREEFCTIWPKAEPVLRTIAKYLPYIPGVGSTAATLIRDLILAGDALSSVVCPKTA